MVNPAKQSIAKRNSRAPKPKTKPVPSMMQVALNPKAYDFTDSAKPKPQQVVTKKPAKNPNAKGKIHNKPNAKGNSSSSPQRDLFNAALNKIGTSLGNDALKGFGSTTGQNKELRVSCTEFLDYTATAEQPVLNYVFNDKQQYFAAGPGAGVNTNISRLEKVEVWALPKSVNAAVAESSFAALFQTPAYRGSNAEDEVPLALSQRTTFINPTFNTKWVKIGMSNFRKLFSDALVRPVYAKQNADNGVVSFQLILIDPDNQEVKPGPVQLKVKITYVQTLPVETTVSISASNSDSFLSIPVPTFTNQFAIMELKSLTDRT